MFTTIKIIATLIIIITLSILYIIRKKDIDNGTPILSVMFVPIIMSAFFLFSIIMLIEKGQTDIKKLSEIHKLEFVLMNNTTIKGEFYKREKEHFLSPNTYYYINLVDSTKYYGDKIISIKEIK